MIKRITSEKSFMLLFVILGELFLASFILSLLALSSSPDNQNWMFQVCLSMTISYIITTFLYLFFTKKSKKTKPFDEIKLSKTINFIPLLLSIGFALLIIIIRVGLNYIVDIASAEEITKNTTTALSTYTGVFPIFVSFIFPIIIGPIFEEITYRGIVGSIFNVFNDKRKSNVILMVITSSVIFGLLHFSTTGQTTDIIMSFLAPFTSGLLYNYLYLKNKNLIYPIITHITYNFIVLMLLK